MKLTFCSTRNGLSRFVIPIAALGVLGVAGCSAPADATAALSVAATVDTLDNGLTLIVHEDHSAPIVSVNIWYHVGSGSEKPGRTGFAHLFEHLMWMGSQNAPYPAYDRMLEGAGASNNGSTTEDRTNYYAFGPKSSLELILWLEADRMGWLLPTMDDTKVDAQREIVKNERRQSYENQPYGKVGDIMPSLMYSADHPYSWPVIGSMADLSAASVEDVSDFFRTWYAPNNAAMVVAGDVDRAQVIEWAEKYFRDVPRGPEIVYPEPSQPRMASDTLVTTTDRVQMARLYYNWHTTSAWSDDDAPLQVASQILTGSKNARLTKRLEHEDQSVAFVAAFPDHRKLAGEFQVIAQGKPGVALSSLQLAIDEELARLAADGPTEREMEQAMNAIEASFLGSIQTVNGKANQLNSYYYQIGEPDGFSRDLERTKAVTAADVQRVVEQYLLGPRAIVSVVPEGQPELHAVARETTQ
jgi:zinc protease